MLQDAVAHAHAALDMLKKTVEQESWLAATTTASVHKKSAEFQVRRHHRYEHMYSAALPWGTWRMK